MSTSSRRGRWLRGALVALIGLLALALPVADLAASVPDPWWGPETLAGDIAVIVLASGLIAGGCWLATRDWEPRYLTAVVVRTYAVTACATVLFAWAIVLQLWSVGDPEPYVIALDGVLIAALIAFSTAVLNVEDTRLSEATRQSEAAYRELAERVIDCSTVATVVVDADGDVAWLNRAAATVFDVDREAAVGRDRDAVVGDAVEQVESATPTAGSCHERLLRASSGADRWFEHSRHGIDDGLHAGGWIEQFTDVTERREAVDALEAVSGLRAQTQGAAGGSISAVLDVGRDRFDAEYAAFTRLDDGQTIETVRSDRADPTEDSVPALHTRSVRAVQRASAVRTGFRDEHEAVGGFEFDHGASESFDAFIAAPVEIDGELVGVVTFLGERTAAFAAWERALAGLLARWVGYEHERSRLVGAQDRRAYEQALDHERERLEFINRIVRHNVLNGLNLVNARTEHLAAGVDDPEAAEHLSVIRSRVDDMADLIDTIRTFMDAALREGQRALEPVPIRAVLEEKLSLAAETYDASFRIHDLPDPDARVLADDLTGEVFENVLSNAVEHNDTDDPTVEIWTTQSTERLPLRGVDAAGADTPAVADGGEHPGEERPVLTVHVADDGPGIPDEQKRRLLRHGEADLSDPGHGFGFYLVREMMESYGGGVRIRDNEPRGTVVDLVFPIEES